MTSIKLTFQGWLDTKSAATLWFFQLVNTRHLRPEFFLLCAHALLNNHEEVKEEKKR